MKIFIDTSAYLAVFVKNEIRHIEVKQIFDKYVNDIYLFFYLYFVLSELYTRVIYTLGNVVLKKIINQIDSSIKSNELRVLDVDEVSFNKSKETMIINFMTTEKVAEVPTSVSYSCSIADYQLTYKLKSNKIIAERSLLYKTNIIPVEKINEFKEFYSKIIAADHKELIFKN